MYSDMRKKEICAREIRCDCVCFILNRNWIGVSFPLRECNMLSLLLLLPQIEVYRNLVSKLFCKLLLILMTSQLNTYG